METWRELKERLTLEMFLSGSVFPPIVWEKLIEMEERLEKLEALVPKPVEPLRQFALGEKGG